MTRIALATSTRLPEPDADEEVLLQALRQRGADVRLIAWDDPTSRAEHDEIVVVRSTWNYVHALDAFVAWVDASARTSRLFNPAPILRGNVRKTYLRDLEARGIDIIPTTFVPRGGEARIDGPWPLVIKPVVSAGSFLTKCFAKSEAQEAQGFLAELTAERDAMIQPWMPTVETSGERCLVWLDGEFTHAVRKDARFAGGAERVSASAVPIADDERAFAERVLDGMTRELLYARVDILRDEAGTLRLMELELVEPSLFLKQHPPALERFADAIVRL